LNSLCRQLAIFLSKVLSDYSSAWH
jgi:hypothetical protein